MIFAKAAPVCVDYRTYKQFFTQGIVESGFIAHARRHFFKIHINDQYEIFIILRRSQAQTPLPDYLLVTRH